MWGFLQSYLNQQTRPPCRAPAASLIGGILLWDVLVRGQLGFSVSFLEEMWSRNMANLLISPLTRAEFLGSLIAMSLIRLVDQPRADRRCSRSGSSATISGRSASALAAFFANLLLTGWAIAILTSGVILRNGLGAEGLVWSLMFLVMPLCAVFYPVAVLPAFLQWVAWCLPPTYVFEGMRAIVFDHVFRADLMLAGLRHQRRADGCRLHRLRQAPRQRPPRRFAHGDRRMIESGSGIDSGGTLAVPPNPELSRPVKSRLKRAVVLAARVPPFDDRLCEDDQRSHCHHPDCHAYLPAFVREREDFGPHPVKFLRNAI